MIASFHELAERELNEAAAYYRQEHNGLGLAFLVRAPLHDQGRPHPYSRRDEPEAAACLLGRAVIDEFEPRAVANAAASAGIAAGLAMDRLRNRRAEVASPSRPGGLSTPVASELAVATGERGVRAESLWPSATVASWIQHVEGRGRVPRPRGPTR
jgi:hypothetical protein